MTVSPRSPRRRAPALLLSLALPFAAAPAASASTPDGHDAADEAAVEAALAEAVDAGAQGNEDPAVLAAVLYTSAHPDLYNRSLGFRSLEDGLPEAAHGQFLRAARHADKPSQAMLAEMYWKGLGVPRDRATGYAWMDLAAERHYRGFILLREAYWAELDEAERARALEVGQALYAEYGDDVAKPRQERAMQRARRATTGSRTGFVGALKVRVPGPGGSTVEVDGSRFYAARYWRPEAYWAWQDEIWISPLPATRVDVGDIEAVAAPPADDAPADADRPR
jgi:hypothetical protein